MPSVIPEFQHAIPTMLKLDNDWAHYGRDATLYLHDAWCPVINWGRAKFPIARRVVEMVFQRLARYEHQMPSTTGSNPFDPRRDRRRERVPLVPISHLPALIDVVLTDLNTRRHGWLNGHSPLEILRSSAQRGLLLRKLPERYRVAGSAFRVETTLPIRGNPTRGRDLSVYHAYGQYSGGVLAQRLALGERKVRVQYNRHDLRFLDVLDRYGRIVGRLNVYGTWKRFPHDESLRRTVHRDSRDHAWRQLDALASYFESLVDNVEQPSNALHLFDVMQRIQGGGGVWEPALAQPAIRQPPPPKLGLSRPIAVGWAPRNLGGLSARAKATP